MRITQADSFANITDIIGKPKRIANNSWQYTRANGDKVIRHQSTDIAIEHKDSTWTLRTGGWQTVTTKARLNEFTPFSIWSNRGVWYISDGEKHGPFVDGMNSKDIGGKRAAKAEKKQKALIARINNFVKQVDTVDELPHPEPGDCWICKFGQTSCLQSHLDENYFHGSLLVAAMKARGFDDRSIGLHFAMNLRQRIKAALKAYLKTHLTAQQDTHNLRKWGDTRAA